MSNIKKSSQMGGGEFEYNPSTLEEKIDNRQAYLETEADIVKEFINKKALIYMKLGYGTMEGYKEYLLKKLVEDFRGVK